MSSSVTILEHFKRLFDFQGREDRASFWPYAAVVFGILMAISMVMVVPMMMQVMTEMQQYAAQHTENATIASGPGHYSISVKGYQPKFMQEGTMALYLAVTLGLAILLYAAAVVRRLRDAGKSGLWGLMPLPFILYSSVRMPSALASGADRDLTTFFSIAVSNMLYLASLIALIVLLAGESKPTADR